MTQQGSSPMLGNIARTVVRQAIAVIVGLLSAIIVARTLGPEGNGALLLALIVPNLLSLIFSLGVPVSNVYFLGRRDFELRDVILANVIAWGVVGVLGALS